MFREYTILNIITSIRLICYFYKQYQVFFFKKSKKTKYATQLVINIKLISIYINLTFRDIQNKNLFKVFFNQTQTNFKFDVHFFIFVFLF